MKEALWNSKVFQCDDDNDGRDNHQNNNELKAIQKNNNDDRDHYNENNALWHLKAFQKKSRRQQNLEIYQVNTLLIDFTAHEIDVKKRKCQGSKICIAYHEALFTDARIDFSLNQ